MVLSGGALSSRLYLADATGSTWHAVPVDGRKARPLLDREFIGGEDTVTVPVGTAEGLFLAIAMPLPSREKWLRAITL